MSIRKPICIKSVDWDDYIQGFSEVRLSLVYIDEKNLLLEWYRIAP